MRRRIRNGGREADRDPRALVAEWASSGKSAGAFGREHGVSASSLYGWRRRLEAEGSAEGGGFVEVVPDSAGSGAIEIRFPNGSIWLRGPRAAQQVVEILRGFAAC